MGVGVGATFACSMDEVIYFQMRKNIILPLQMVSLKRNSG